MKIKIEYPNRNTKSLTVSVGELTLYFSYETLIAFDCPRYGFWISENVWGTTTGRHLNEIHPDKTLRVGNFAFNAQVELMLKYHNLN